MGGSGKGRVVGIKVRWGTGREGEVGVFMPGVWNHWEEAQCASVVVAPSLLLLSFLLVFLPSSRSSKAVQPSQVKSFSFKKRGRLGSMREIDEWEEGERAAKKANLPTWHKKEKQKAKMGCAWQGKVGGGAWQE